MDNSVDRREDLPLEEALDLLGRVLAESGLEFEMLAIGGGALQLGGLSTRPTTDIDIVALVKDARLVPLAGLPEQLRQAAIDVARVLRVRPDWINAAARSLMDFGLPVGTLERSHRRQWGGLILHLADRRDQIFFKLYAAVDQGPRSKHFEDLKRLRPTPDELRAAAAWARTHDPSDGFAQELRGALRDLGVDDGNA